MSPQPDSPDRAVRIASAADVDEIVRVTNLAFLAEAFCVTGNRTNADDIRERLTMGGFLVVDAPNGTSLIGSVYVTHQAPRGYLGLLSVDPASQGHGISRLLMNAATDRCREAGCDFLDITVINVREDLFLFYAKYDFVIDGVTEFPRPERMRQPITLVKMTKVLRPRTHLMMPT